MSDKEPEKRKKTGGRQPGTPNKLTQSVKEMIDAKGVNPIEAMADCLLEAIAEKNTQQVIHIADKLAPYYAPKLAAMKVEGDLSVDHQNAGLQETLSFIREATGK